MNLQSEEIDNMASKTETIHFRPAFADEAHDCPYGFTHIGCCQCVEDVHHASTEHLLTGHSALHYAATDNADSADNEVEDNDYHGQMYGGDRIEWFKKADDDRRGDELPKERIAQHSTSEKAYGSYEREQLDVKQPSGDYWDQDQREDRSREDRRD